MVLNVQAGEMVMIACLVGVKSLVVNTDARHLMANLAVALDSAQSLSCVLRQTTSAQSLLPQGLASCEDSTQLTTYPLSRDSWSMVLACMLIQNHRAAEEKFRQIQDSRWSHACCN